MPEGVNIGLLVLDSLYCLPLKGYKLDRLTRQSILGSVYLTKYELKRELKVNGLTIVARKTMIKH